MHRIACLLLVLLPAWSAAAEEGRSTSAAGQLLFVTYCASCHGVDGHGQGPAASALLSPPPDLTLLSEKYGPPLPRATLAELIDGRRELRAHGSREMPVWGKRFFVDPADAGNREGAKQQTIRLILDYLESIQRTRDARGPEAKPRRSG